MQYTGYWRNSNGENVEGIKDSSVSWLRKHLRSIARSAEGASYEIISEESDIEVGFFTGGKWLVEKYSL